MDISKTGKEKTVIIFFALVLVAVIVMAIIDPQPPGEDEHDHGDTALSDVTLSERIEEAKARVDAEPKNTHLLIDLGDLYMDNNQIKEALNTFNKVIAIDPNNVHALSDLGVIYQQTGFYDKAIEYFTKVLNIDPEDVSAIYYLGMLNRYYKKDNKEALKLFEKLLTKVLDPKLTETIQKEIKAIKSETK